MKSFNDVAKQHQRRIAYKTLQMSDAAVFILGGMTKEEARLILAGEVVETVKNMFPGAKVRVK